MGLLEAVKAGRVLSPDETGLSSQAVPPIPRVPLPVWQDVATMPRLGASPCSSRCSICQLCPLPRRAGLAPDYLCGCVCPLSVPGSRECSVNEYGTFLRLSTPGFLWGPGHLASPDLKRGLCLLFPLTSQICLHPLPQAVAKVATGVLLCPCLPSPGSHSFQGRWGEGRPASAEHTLPPHSAARSRLTRPHPALPPDRKEVMHLLLLIIYLFGETEMM